MPSNHKGRGVLQVSAAQTKKPAKQQQSQQPQQPRPPAPKLRLIIRRLPPGLTESEFWNTIGPEWKVGSGKVDWAAFRSGNISTDLAEPSRPARAYLKVKDIGLLDLLAAHVKSTAFRDAKNSINDSCLVGPPSLEFAPYPKIPHSRIRHDGRQGTIDQDSEFIDFLQSLTEPVAKGGTSEEANQSKLDKASVTPLVQYIKDKKAIKAKEKETLVSVKSTKKAVDAKDAKDAKGVQDVKDIKAAAASSKTEQAVVVKKGVQTDTEKARVAKATQQAMDSIKKSVAEIKGHTTPKQESKTSDKKDTAPVPATPKKDRQRGDASVAARIIGRDLGLVPKEARTPKGQRAAATPASASTAATSTTTPASPATSKPISSKAVPKAPASSQTPEQAPLQAPTGPRNLRNQNPQSQSQSQSPRQPVVPVPAKLKTGPQPSNGAKSAFLKHANPSQGVTEDLLRTAFSAYGTLVRCEIDKKKGLGYIDFTDTDGLRKAMAASPVKIGNGSVVVLENRTPYKKVSQGSARNHTPSPGPSVPSSPKPVQPVLATIAEQTAPSSPSKAQSTASTSKASNNAAATKSTPGTNGVSKPTDTKKPLVTPSVDNDITKSDENPDSTPSSAEASQTLSKGGRGANRGNFRGRGYRGRGSARGGTRAANSPNPSVNAPTTPQASTSAVGEKKT